jgi:hypothetical protein
LNLLLDYPVITTTLSDNCTIASFLWVLKLFFFSSWYPMSFLPTFSKINTNSTVLLAQSQDTFICIYFKFPNWHNPLLYTSGSISCFELHKLQNS